MSAQQIQNQTDYHYIVLPLRDIIVFPHMIVPLFVSRKKSINALENILKRQKKVFLLTQKESDKEDPSQEDLYQTGTVANILQLLRLPDGTVKVLVEGWKRARVETFIAGDAFFEAVVSYPSEAEDEPTAVEKRLSDKIFNIFEAYVKKSKKLPQESVATIKKIKDFGHRADMIAAHLHLSIEEKQVLLELPHLSERLKRLREILEAELGVLQVEKKIRGRVKRQMEKTQREYYLNEQLKAIQKELGESDDGREELRELSEKIEKIHLTAEAREKAEGELKKLHAMNPMSAEATVVRNYLDWLLGIPWGELKKTDINIKRAQEILDEDHYGLDKIKERILEYLAVQQRKKKVKGSILCLVGPPGVGKTSLGRSIARASGREFIRLSLGGVHDESEIRGHRRTYIGSLPGKIIQSMRKAKVSNPLFLLDEIDKIGQDYRGDPSSALLEVLDPEQNSTFMDHYLEVEYDLSNVMFVTTANTLQMPEPLLDRMELIRVAGYTEEEKIEIARRHLLSKQREENGLELKEWKVSTQAIRDLIRYYTREAGVRNLEREVANLMRKAIVEILKGQHEQVSISVRNLEDYAGVRRYNYGKVKKEHQIGVTTGLAWTRLGGELLSIEAITTPGDGKMILTGKLGDVMQESVQAARSWVYAHVDSLGIDRKLFEEKNIHIHVPEGATPKDGPSAGIAMVNSIVSVLLGKPIRCNLAMTGEVTLQGYVLPIGGLKEKLMAAVRGGVDVVIIPKGNKKDLVEIPDTITQKLHIISVDKVEDMLQHSFRLKIKNDAKP